jgi:hypothetical protein
MAVEVRIGELIREKRGVVTQSVVSVLRPRIISHVQIGAVKIIEELSQAVGADRSKREEHLNLGTFVERVDEAEVVVVRGRIVVVDNLLVVREHDGLASQMLAFLQLILLVRDELISSGLLEIAGEALVSLDRGDAEHHDESGSDSQHSDKAINRICVLEILIRFVNLPKFEWLAGAISTR